MEAILYEVDIRLLGRLESGHYTGAEFSKSSIFLVEVSEMILIIVILSPRVDCFIF